MLKLQAQDDPRIEGWLTKRTDKYTSADIQNEILKVIALHVLRKVVSSLHLTRFVTVMMDETTDASNFEQVVICLRWVDGNLDAHEDLLDSTKLLAQKPPLSSRYYGKVEHIILGANVMIEHHQ